MTVIVTGAKGMIGSELVKGLSDAGYDVIGIDRCCEDRVEGNCRFIKADLADKEKLAKVFNGNKIDRVIHLAALAHTAGEKDLSWERYKHINVDCAVNVFEAAGNIPVLFISTVDVFGFYDGKEPVNENSPLRPVSYYGKSKALAEEACRKLNSYTVFRLSPVYTDTVKRDIMKRYYLKYPSIAYRIGKGTSYEILNVKNAVAAMVGWCKTEPENNVKIIKDEELMWTPAYIKAEKTAGRAKIVLWIPRWTVRAAFKAAKRIFGENGKTYLLNKAAYPLRSK